MIRRSHRPTALSDDGLDGQQVRAGRCTLALGDELGHVAHVPTDGWPQPAGADLLRHVDFARHHIPSARICLHLGYPEGQARSEGSNLACTCRKGHGRVAWNQYCAPRESANALT